MLIIVISNKQFSYIQFIIWCFGICVAQSIHAHKSSCMLKHVSQYQNQDGIVECVALKCAYPHAYTFIYRAQITQITKVFVKMVIVSNGMVGRAPAQTCFVCVTQIHLVLAFVVVNIIIVIVDAVCRQRPSPLL